MLLNLYITTDDMRVLNKTLTLVKNISAIPVEGVSILTPKFIIEYDTDIKNANYCYISELSRYYFINEIVLLTGNRIQLNCTVDVLKTYANDLKNCLAVITRSESIGKPTKIIDKSLPIDPNKKELLTAKKDFTTNFNNMYLVRVRESAVKYTEV